MDQSLFLQIMHEQSILPKVFKFLLNSNTEALDFNKTGKVIPYERTFKIQSSFHTLYTLQMVVTERALCLDYMISFYY